MFIITDAELSLLWEKKEYS